MPEILHCAFWLAVIYQIKHFLADYVFQNAYMLKKGNADWTFVKPLLAHAGVHGGFTFILSLLILHDFKWALILALADLVIHFIMDRLKASPRYLGRYHLSSDPHEAHLYWTAFGFDQMIHHLTHLGLIAALICIKYYP